MQYIYFWYHHLYISSNEQENIRKHIANHDFEAFLQFYTWYQLNTLNNPENWTYFPDTIIVYDDDNKFIDRISVFDRNNFSKITHNESECG